MRISGGVSQRGWKSAPRRDRRTRSTMRPWATKLVQAPSRRTTPGLPSMSATEHLPRRGNRWNEFRLTRLADLMQDARPKVACSQGWDGMSETLSTRISARTATVGIIGLGYVGLPLARAFTNAGLRVIGFDIDTSKVTKL